MSEVIIPASPNWYCTRVVDSNKFGYFVFAARHDVVIFDCQSFPINYRGVFVSHREKVTSLSVSSHEQYSSLCCSAGEDGSVKVWCMESREDRQAHSLHSNKVTSICWSPIQPDLIVSGDDAGNVAVWQFEDDRQTINRPDKGSVMCISASPSNSSIMAVGYKTGQIYLVDVKKGAFIVMRLKGHDEEIHSLIWCPVPGEEFRPSSSKEDITDLESFGVETSWRTKLKPKNTDGQFGSDGWLLASGSKDRTIRVWSTSKGRQLLLLKLPSVGRRERTDDSGKSKLWLTLCWPPWSPGKFVSGCQSGDLLEWDITKDGKERCQSFQSLGKGHSRFAFNICPVETVKDVKILCAVSMDRTISFWNADIRCQMGALPSLGGYVYAINTSPFDPGRVAIGVGDAMIRLWNLNALPESNEMISLWQGIRSKVTALCWHPVKEGLLAYGTDDGRVGIYDTLSHKPPSISTTYHRRTVYGVCWGPPSVLTVSESTGKQPYHLYSCGDGNILEHRRDKLNTEAPLINKLIQSSNPGYRNQTRVPTRSEITWFHDFSVVVVGNDDGTVEVYRPPSFKLLATIQVQHKLINSLRWHPHITMASPSGSPYKHWLAIASNESIISIVDLSNVLEKNEIEEPLQITENLRTLEGHSQRITCTSWSPHNDGQLVSVSYDGYAIVWNAMEGTVLSCYQGHIGRLLYVEWSGLDPDKIMTGGDDFSLHMWQISVHTVKDGHLESRQKKKKKKGKVPQDIRSLPAAEASKVEMVNGMESNSVTETMGDMSELEIQKRALLDRVDEILDKDTINELNQDDDIVVGDGSVASTQPSAKGDNVANKQGESASSKKKRRPKSMFPVMSKRENRGKQYIQGDIVTLARIIFEAGSTAGPSDMIKKEDNIHLGLFLDRRSTYLCLQSEGEYHRNNENMEYFYQLEIWKGNINGVLKAARQRDELSDWLVAMTPMASFDTWMSVCEDYALQLESDGQYHKAASYFLACHKVYEAIKLFKRHKLFKEAIALAKVRLSPLDPALEELYTLWAQQLTKDGNYEQAAKCHLAMKQVQDAAKLLARRYDQSSLRTAAHISMIANDKQQGLMYTQRVVQQHLLQYEWKEAYTFLQSQKETQVFLATSSIHEIVVSELTQVGTLNVDRSHCTIWDQKTTQKIILPEFILDQGDVDCLAPWQPYLVDGHTFPHHILRTWYNHLDISMDTTSLEDMYKTLSLLHAGRQSQVDLPQVLIQVCTDLALCMLSLMMSETPTAMSHLLQAVGSLHETGHVEVMQGLLRFFLPQGPKYILKLQQEVTAMRVMISMDTHSVVDGASKAHTLKRYLTDLKDENLVNTSSLRCRELDCLRAFYYVAILMFLKEHSGEITNREHSVDQTALSGGNPDATDNPLNSQEVTDNQIETGENVCVQVDDTSKVESLDDVVKTTGENMAKGDAKDTSESAIAQEDSEKQELDESGICDNEEKVQSKNSSITNIVSSPETVSKAMANRSPHSRLQTLPLNMSHLVQLSQGILWDLQAKRFALTETLGYIHKAISQLLLSKNTKPVETQGSASSETQEGTTDNKTDPERISTDKVVDNMSKSETDQRNDNEARTETSSSTLSGMDQAEGATAAESNDMITDSNIDNPALEGGHCPHHHFGNGEDHICHSMLSHHFDHMLNIHNPHRTEIPDNPLADLDVGVGGDLLDICTSCQSLQKSRKILWEDEPHFLSRQEGGLKDMTILVNPAKYINVPDEWYNMPVDQKYFKPYVTMAILKDEQEYVMHELKRGPDITQAPFPNPLDSVKNLLDISKFSSRVQKVDQNEFAQKVIAWALNFAVTTQQKEAFIGYLQSQLNTN